MKIIYILFFVFLLIFNFKKTYAKSFNYIDIGITDVNEFWTNLSGGLSKTKTYYGYTEADVDIHLDKIFKGNFGNIHLSGLNVRGKPISNSVLQPLDFISNIENNNSTRIFEMYYENQITDNIDIKIGKFDVTTDFSLQQSLTYFLNASAMTSMVINNDTYNQTNYGATSTPSFEISYSKNNWTYTGIITSDNPNDINMSSDNASNVPPPKSNTEFNFHGPILFYEVEKDYKINGNDGVIQVGGFYDFGKQQLYNNSTHKSNGAMYISLEQNFYNNKLTYFVRYFYDYKKNNVQIKDTLDTGLIYHTYILSNKDMFGLNLSYAGLNINNKKEYRIEATSRIYVNDSIYLQPDIQYIIHPGAGSDDSIIKNEFVFGFRSYMAW